MTLIDTNRARDTKWFILSNKLASFCLKGCAFGGLESATLSKYCQLAYSWTKSRSMASCFIAIPCLLNRMKGTFIFYQSN